MHEPAMITEHRTICKCGWHKKIKGKKNGLAAMVRHQEHPTEPPCINTVQEHAGEGCDIRPFSNTWTACHTHNVWLIPDATETPAQEEMSLS